MKTVLSVNSFLTPIIINDSDIPYHFQCTIPEEIRKRRGGNNNNSNRKHQIDSSSDLEENDYHPFVGQTPAYKKLNSLYSYSLINDSLNDMIFDDEIPLDDSEEEEDVRDLSDQENSNPRLNYFQDLSEVRKTSNKIITRKLTASEYRDLYNNSKKKHVDEKNFLFQKYTKSFVKYSFLLNEGYNLLFYGFGSKKDLLDTFSNCKYLMDGDVVTVNGFFPSINFKEILKSILSLISSDSRVGGSIQEMVMEITKKIKNRIYLFIHSIDSPALLKTSTINFLSSLASIPNIKIVASADTVHAGLSFSSAVALSFNFIYFDVSTFIDYDLEIENDIKLGVENTSVVCSVKRVLFVLRNLPQKSQEIFKTLANHVIEQQSDEYDSDFGLAYSSFFSKCYEKFLITDDQSFKRHLTEFLDHQVFKISENDNGIEVYSIPLSTNDLKEILEQIYE
jgi:origin recognition complex subunit 2